MTTDRITDDQRERLRALVFLMRRRAAPHGPLHSLWDVIFDVEAFLNRKRTVLTMTADEWVAYCQKCLGDEPGW